MLSEWARAARAGERWNCALKIKALAGTSSVWRCAIFYMMQALADFGARNVVSLSQETYKGGQLALLPCAVAILQYFLQTPAAGLASRLDCAAVLKRPAHAPALAARLARDKYAVRINAVALGRAGGAVARN